MTRAEEERLVAMYFDNSDFEKHAKETINTLGQLKQSMNLEDASKGFDVFDKMKTSTTMGKMQKSASKLKDTMSTIGSTLTKSITSIGGAPLRTFENTLSTMRGYISKYLGFDLASKLVGSMESMIRGLTIQPISQGWNQYETKMDSVKTIMSSTGETIQNVERNLSQLQYYADKTVYSLNDMTSNIGKFTNNGVKLEDATKAMMGVANAAADAGQGTQQASMAMYNFSQAIGVGKMTTIDWKSIENANMATKRLKDTFIQLAAIDDRYLKKVDDGKGGFKYFYTKDSNGKEIKDQRKWVEVNYQNFRETLKYDWLTSETMVNAMKAYSGQFTSVEALMSGLGIKDEKLAQQLFEVGQNALEAAAQVRTFSKMIDSLKDAASSGWANTFQLLFGNMEQGTNLWTRLSEKIGGVLDGNAEWRNGLLRDWGEMRELLKVDRMDSGSTSGIVEQYYFGRNGREILQDTLFNLLDLFGELRTAIKNALAEMFGLDKLDGTKLFELTQKLEEAVKKLVDWFGKANDEGSRMNKIQRIAKGIFGAFKTGLNVLKAIWNVIGPLLAPTFDWLLDILSRIGDFFAELANSDPSEIFAKIGEKLKNVWTKVLKFFTPQAIYDQKGNKIGEEIPAVTWLKNTWETIKDVASKVSTALGLDKVWAAITGAWDSLVAEIESSSVISEIAAFLGNTWNWIVEKATTMGLAVYNFFKPDENGESEFTKWLSGFWARVVEIWDKLVKDIENSGILKEIGRFLGNTWAWIVEKAKDVYKAISSIFEPDDEGQSKFTKWLGSFWDRVVEIWDGLVKKIQGSKVLQEIGQFLSNAWQWIINLGKREDPKRHFYKITGEANPNEGKSDFISWLEGFWDRVVSVWDGLVKSIENSKTLQEIGKFLGDTWTWIVNFAKDAVREVKEFLTPDDSGKSDFVEWLSSFWNNVVKIWNELVESIKNSPILHSIGQFLRNAWQWIINLGKREDPKRHFYKITGEANPNEGKSDFISWLEGFWDRVVEIWDGLVKKIQGSKALQEIGKFLGDAWTWIVNLAKDGIETVRDFLTPDDSGKSDFVEWLSSFWDNVVKIWNELVESIKNSPILHSIGQFLNNAWRWIINLGKRDDPKRHFYKITGEANPNEGKSDFIKWLEGFWDNVTSVWNGLVEKIKNSDVLQAIGSFLSDTWNWILSLFNGEPVETEEVSSEVVTDNLENVQETAEDIGEEANNTTSVIDSVSGFFTSLFASISELWDKITKFISEHNGIEFSDIETFVSGVSTAIGGLMTEVGNLLSAVGKWFKGEKWNTDELNALTNLLVIGVLPILAKLFSGITDLGVGLLAKGFGIDLVSLGSEFRDIGIGIAAIFGTIIALKLTGVTTTDLLTYGPWIAGAMALVGIIIAAISSLSKNLSQNKSIFDGSGVLKKLIGALEKAGIIAIVMALLPEVLRAYGEAKAEMNGADFGWDLAIIFVSLAAGIGAMSLVVLAISAISTLIPPGGLLKGAGALILAIGSITGVLALMNWLLPSVADAEALAQKASNVRDAIKNTFGIITDLVDVVVGDVIPTAAEGVGKSVGGFFGGIWRGATGKMTDEDKIILDEAMIELRIDTMTQQLIKLSEALSTEKIEQIGSLVDSIADAAGKMRTVSGSINFEGFADGFPTLVGGILGIFKALATDDNSLSKYIDEYGTDKVERVLRVTRMALGIFSDLGTGAAEVFMQANVGQGNPFASFWNNFDTFFDVGDTSDYSNGEASKSWFAMTLDTVISAYETLNEYESRLMPYADQKYTTMIDVINNLFGILNSIVTRTNIDFFGMSGEDVRENFWGNIADALKGDDLKDALTNAEGMYSFLGNLQGTIDELPPLELKIQPVFNMEKLTLEELQKELNNYMLTVPTSIDMPQMSLDAETLHGALDIEGIKAQLQAINDSINSWGEVHSTNIVALEPHIDRVGGALAGARVVLNTGALVGQLLPYIDVGLYKRAVSQSRGGSVNLPGSRTDAEQ